MVVKFSLVEPLDVIVVIGMNVPIMMEQDPVFRNLMFLLKIELMKMLMQVLTKELIKFKLLLKVLLNQQPEILIMQEDKSKISLENWHKDGLQIPKES